MKLALILPKYFALQSYLQPSIAHRRRQQTLGVLILLMIAGATIVEASRNLAIVAFGYGLMAPGAGFAVSMLSLGVLQPFAVVALAITMLAFGFALLLWFATGNVLAPPLVWIGSAILTAVHAQASPSPIPGTGHAALLAGGVASLALFGLGLPRRRVAPSPAAAVPTPIAMEPCRELDLETLQLQRVLLDRALQPVEAFDGFEWRDQFQTAAVRYQVNFLSYALSLSNAHQLPAFTGYMVEAQRRLLAKQSEPRMWRYWALESAWGHLRRSADPVPRDNIMYSGFVAAQIAFAEAACGCSLAKEGAHLRLSLPDRDVRYGIGDLTGILADQYRASPWGLLACEPHWIYPLCNLITANALASADVQARTCHWRAIEPTFRSGLIREFMTADGRIVPFRSSITGWGFPAAGGIVMQAFPCLFLNAILPDIAAEMWSRVSARLASARWSRAFWPIDVGNYGLSRASSLAASAAAATEMGDGANAAAMLARLDRECPSVLVGGVRHRPRASLWSHAMEVAARTNHVGGLATLVAKPMRRDGPYLAEACYPAVLVASAVAGREGLRLVLYPGGEPGIHNIGLAGLKPDRHYRIEGGVHAFLRADATGAASLAVALDGRTPLRILPVI